MINSKYLFFILLFFSLIVFLKVFFLYDIIPHPDQASYVYWMQTLFNSTSFFPSNSYEISFMQGLKYDDLSFLHNLLKPLYLSTTNLFTVNSLFIFSLISYLFDPTIKVQIIFSIIFNNLVILIITLYLFNKSKQNLKLINISLVCFVILNLNSYFYGFSTYGTHNLGILFLTINLIFFQNYLNKINSKNIFLKDRIVYFFIQFLAFYTMYTNVFLISITCLLGILLSKINFRIKIKEFFIFSTSTVIILIPAIILLLVSLENSENDQGFILWGKWAFSQNQGFDEFNLYEYLKSNLISWYNFNSKIFGYFLFPLSFFGLLILKKKFSVDVFIYLFLSHFIISFSMAGFNYAQERTSSYLMPFCSLGISIIIYQLIVNLNKFFKYRRYVLFSFIFLILSYSIFEIAKDAKKLVFPQNIEADWSNRYDDDKNQFRITYQFINNNLKENSLIITSKNSYRIIFHVLSYNNKNLKYLFAVDSHTKNNEIRDKINTNYLLNTKYKNIYFIYNENDNYKESINRLKKYLCKIDESFCLKYFENLLIYDETNFKLVQIK